MSPRNRFVLWSVCSALIVLLFPSCILCVLSDQKKDLGRVADILRPWLKYASPVFLLTFFSNRFLFALLFLCLDLYFMYTYIDSEIRKQFEDVMDDAERADFAQLLRGEGGNVHRALPCCSIQ